MSFDINEFLYGTWIMKKNARMRAKKLYGENIQDQIQNSTNIRRFNEANEKNFIKMTSEDFIKISRDPYVISSSGVAGEMLNLDYVMILFAQAWHETGGFTSQAYKQRKNMFGMNPATKRKKFWDYEDGKDGRAGYHDIPQPGIAKSMADRLNWDVYNRIVYKDPRQYMEAVLGNNQNGLKYAPDHDAYLKAWVRNINTVYDNAGMKRPFIKGFTSGTPDGSLANDGGTTSEEGNTGNKTDEAKDNDKIFGLPPIIVIGCVCGILYWRFGASE